MPQAQDFLCDLCGEFTSLQANPFTVMLHLDQPGDRVGTVYDLSKVHLFIAFVSGMRIPRLEACDLCCFIGLKAIDGSRTRPPLFTVEMSGELLAYFERHGASLEYPGLSQTAVAEIKRSEAMNAPPSQAAPAPVVVIAANSAP